MATALTGSDPTDTVCRQTVPKVNWRELLTPWFIALLYGEHAFEGLTKILRRMHFEFEAVGDVTTVVSSRRTSRPASQGKLA